MAKTNPTTGSLNLPIIPDLGRWFRNVLQIGSFRESFAHLVLSTCGLGKSATLRSLAAEGYPIFFIPGGAYSEMTAMVPTPHRILPDKKVFVKIGKEVEELDIPDRFKDIVFEKMVDAASTVNMEMISPRYMKLENFLKEADAIWKKSKKIPLVVLDEATMMPRKSRDRFFTDVVDGNLPAELGVKKPLTVLLGNGRYGGSSNEPQEIRQVHRTFQWIYYPQAGEIPSDVSNFNSSVAKKMREKSRIETINEMTSGESSVLTAREFPRNKCGNPRAQETFMWFCLRTKKLGLPDPVKFLTEAAQGFFLPGHDLTDSVSAARQLFSVLPATMEEVREYLNDDKKKIPQSILDLAKQAPSWISWAGYVSSGTDAEAEELAHFAKLAGCPKEVVEAIKTTRASTEGEDY